MSCSVSARNLLQDRCQHDYKRLVNLKRSKIWFGFHEAEPLGIIASCWEIWFWKQQEQGVLF